MAGRPVDPGPRRIGPCRIGRRRIGSRRIGRRIGRRRVGRRRSGGGTGRPPSAHDHQRAHEHEHHEGPGGSTEGVDRHEPVGHRPGQGAGVVEGHRVPGHRRRVASGPQRRVHDGPGHHRHHGGDGHGRRRPPSPPPIASHQGHDDDGGGGAGGQTDLAGGHPEHDQRTEGDEPAPPRLVDVAIEGHQRGHGEEDEQRLGPGHPVGQEQVGGQQQQHRQAGPPGRPGPAGHGDEGEGGGQGQDDGVEDAGDGEHVRAGELRAGRDGGGVQRRERRQGDPLTHHDRVGGPARCWAGTAWSARGPGPTPGPRSGTRPSRCSCPRRGG